MGPQFWASAEYLRWWTKGGSVPPLATTGPAATGGVLRAPGTTILSGGDQGNRDPYSGGRFTVGFWFNDCHVLGAEASYFFLNQRSNGFSASSSGGADSAVLSRPFFNVISGRQDAQVVSFPGLASGGVQTSSRSQMQGGDLNLLFNPLCPPACPTISCGQAGCAPPAIYRLNLFAGPRWLQLNEDLVVAEQVTDATGTLFSIVDRFETRNNFYGGQVGARGEWQRGRFFVNLFGKVALGVTHQEVRISGTTAITGPGVVPSVQQGGLLALPTNIGTYSQDRFSVVPEINLNAGYQVTRHMRIFAGYSFLYWSNVVRPGDQIDLGINPTQLPTAAGPGVLAGPARPAFNFHESSFWAHGINVGLEFRW